MSYNNRLREYDRLVALGRDRDIPKSLMDEFGKPKDSSKPIPLKSKKVKKKC